MEERGLSPAQCENLEGVFFIGKVQEKVKVLANGMSVSEEQSGKKWLCLRWSGIAGKRRCLLSKKSCKVYVTYFHLFSQSKDGGFRPSDSRQAGHMPPSPAPSGRGLPQSGHVVGKLGMVTNS